MKETKNGHFHNVGKVGKSNATPIKLFSVDFYDLITMPFKLGKDIISTFEMPESYYKKPLWKFNISLLFCPFASEVLDLINVVNLLATESPTHFDDSRAFAHDWSLTDQALKK